MKNVIVTGAAGFLGEYISRLFKNNNWSVIGIDAVSKDRLFNPVFSHYYSIKLPSKKIDEVIKKHAPILCVHCAGTASVGNSMTNPDEDFYNNTIVTFELLHSIKKNSPDCKTIFLSSAAVYGNQSKLPIKEDFTVSPISHYGKHKLQCEQICAEFNKIYNMPITIVRIFSAYGPGLRKQVIWDICYKSATSDCLNLQGTGNESRDFIHATDIARAIYLIADKSPMEGEIYNLATGVEIKISELVELVLESTNQRKEIAYGGLVPNGVPKNWKADISMIKAIGFIPTITFKEGIRSYCEWSMDEILVSGGPIN